MVETVVVADAERDDVLRSFGDPEVITQGARRLAQAARREPSAKTGVADLADLAPLA